MTDRRPLDGVRVLDLSNLLAGPMATMYLADFGAEVIKVEHPSKPDELRNWGNAKDGVGLFFKVLNRGKKTIGLDLRAPEGVELALRLAAESDVVCESFRPGTMERWGLGPDDLRAANPRLVILRVSGFGQTGPYSPRPGFGTLAEAFSGAAHITGFPDRSPLLPSFGLGDTSTAIFGAFAVVLALYNRDAAGGEGQVVDLALYEGLLTLLGPQVVDFDQLGIVQQRDGSRLPFVSPRNTYHSADGKWLAIAGSTQATFERIARALGLDGLLVDARFATNHLRIENAEALDEALQQAVGKLTLDEALGILEREGAPAGPVNDVRQVVEDPHVRARENVAAVADEELGTVRMQNVVPRLTATPGRIGHAGPRHREHNHEVYGRVLGLSGEEIGRLEREGVV